MKLKFLIILPMILTLGIILGHLMQVFAFSATAIDPGHPASEIGGTVISDRTFTSGDYVFQGALTVNDSLIKQGGGDFVIRDQHGVSQREAQFYDIDGRLYIRSDLNSDTDKSGSIQLYAANTYIEGKLNVDDIYATTNRLTLMPASASDYVQVGYGQQPRDLQVWGNLNVNGNIKGIKFATKIQDSNGYPNYITLTQNYNDHVIFSVVSDEGHTSLILEYTAWDVNDADSSHDKYWARLTFSDGTTRDEDIQEYLGNPFQKEHDNIITDGDNYYKNWGNNKAVVKWEIWGRVFFTNTQFRARFQGWQI